MFSLADPERMAGRVLDAGCGVGNLLERLTAPGKAIGVDFSLGMIRAASRRSPSVLLGDSMKLPFRDESFDLVLARSLLHHLPNIERGISELARVLRPGGQLVVADTNRSVLTSLPRALAYRGPGFSPDHKNLRARDLADALAARLAIESVRFFGFLAYPFGFPDIMGRLGRLPFPVFLVNGLIALDRILARIPGFRRLAWGVFVVGRKI